MNSEYELPSNARESVARVSRSIKSITCHHVLIPSSARNALVKDPLVSIMSGGKQHEAGDSQAELSSTYTDKYGREHRLIRVCRVDRPSFEHFYDNFVRAEKPAVLTGMTETWRTHRWRDLAYLQSRVGHRSVYPRRRLGLGLGDEHAGPMTVQSFLQRAREDGLYLAIATLIRPPPDSFNALFERRRHPGYLPELADDFEVPLFSSRDIWEINLWMGPHGSETPLHRDEFHNLLAVVSGRKRLVLLPWQEVQRRDRGSNVEDRGSAGGGYFCTLEEGETLYIPPFYYHHVWSEGAWSIALNMWFLRGWRDYRSLIARAPYATLTWLKSASSLVKLVALMTRHLMRKRQRNHHDPVLGPAVYD